MPQAKTLIAEILAQAITDGLVPSSFTQRCIDSPQDGKLAGAAVVPPPMDIGEAVVLERQFSLGTIERVLSADAKTSTSPPLSNVARVGLLARAKLLRGIAGSKNEQPAQHRAVDKLAASIAGLLRTYLECQDLREVSRALWDLRVPYFFHEVVAQIVTLGLRGHEETVAPLSRLMELLATSGMITEDQAIKGLTRAMEMVALDHERISVLGQLIRSAEAVLPATYIESLPEELKVQVRASHWVRATAPPTPGSPVHGKRGEVEKEAAIMAGESLLRSWSVAEAVRRLATIDTPHKAYFVEYVITEAVLGSEAQRDLVSSSIHLLCSQTEAEILLANQANDGEEEPDLEEQEANHQP